MNSYVVDVSVAIKWYFNEEHADKARLLLRRKPKMAIPGIFPLEFDQVLIKRIRRKEILVSQAMDIRSSLREIPMKIHPIAEYSESAFYIASRTGCAVYDAHYLALAISLGIAFVTDDQKLQRTVRDTAYGENLLSIENLR